MFSVMELINSFDQNSKEYTVFLQDFLKSSNDIPYDKETINTFHNHIISAINSRLNEAVTRHDGLILLDLILPTITGDTISKNGILWITKVTQVLENTHNCIKDITLACKVGGNLIIRLKGVHELQKQISMQNVKHLITAISNLNKDKRCAAIYFLIAILLHHYPEACEKLQNQIRMISLHQLDTTQDNLVCAGAKCYTLLAKSIGRTFKAPPSKSSYTAWLYSELCICNNLHSILSELFSSIIELDQGDIEDKLELSTISEDNIIDYYMNQKIRFLNLCTYLSTMLRGFGEKNNVNPNDILELLCRGLAIMPHHCKSENISKMHNLYLILPKLHLGLLNVLEAFIDGFRQELIPYAHTILKLCEHTFNFIRMYNSDTESNFNLNAELNSRTDTTIGGGKQFESLKMTVYKCLSSWLLYAGSSSGVELIYHMNLNDILQDILPEKDSVLLNTKVNAQHLTRKALKRLRESNSGKVDDSGNDSGNCTTTILSPKLCTEAHIVLQNIISNVGCWLKQPDYINIQNILLATSYETYLSSSQNCFYQKHSQCRLQLLRSLRVFMIHPYPKMASPVQYAMGIFEMALNDTNVHVIQEAKVTLNELQKILHPSGPTLQLPLTQEMLVDNLNNGDDVGNHNGEHENLNGIQTSKRLKLSVLTDSVEPVDEETMHSKTISSKGNELTENEANISIEESIGINNQSPDESVQNGVDETSSSSFVKEKLIEQNGISNRTRNDEHKSDVFSLFNLSEEDAEITKTHQIKDGNDEESENLLESFHDEVKQS